MMISKTGVSVFSRLAFEHASVCLHRVVVPAYKQQQAKGARMK